MFHLDSVRLPLKSFRKGGKTSHGVTAEVVVTTTPGNKAMGYNPETVGVRRTSTKGWVTSPQLISPQAQLNSAQLSSAQLFL